MVTYVATMNETCGSINYRLQVPYTTVYITPPLGRFSKVDISTVGMVSAPKRSAMEISRRELSEDVSFGIAGALLVVEQSKAAPGGGVIYTDRGIRY